VGEAFLWGAIGPSALLVGALIACLWNPSKQLVAIGFALSIVLSA
jgi:hypothetical protein